MTQALWQLFSVFLQIGAFSIGGGYAVIPMIRDQVVIHQGWITQKVFTDIITISQMTPGPLAINTSTFVGLQIAGIPGAVAATLGCIIPGVAAALLLQYGQEPEESCREIAPILAKNLTKSQIMRTIELLQKYRGECTYNVGTGHVLGAIAVELEGIL